ncbi:unnamed protein product [Meganyctiphanes norvegica]|uniref:Reverse transcriptase domain-containing protein n=1 Tax=Meganyctiphanes norvegica TaxID=48144 RepID=A0AAV2PM46_MEGNR
MLTWIISFLSNRQIQVILENKYSSKLNINCGVPQGSILSPILFIILLSTLPQGILPIVSNELADDIAFSVTAKTMERAEMLMQDAIERLEGWCNSVKLNINIQKTKVMCFTSKRLNTPSLKLNGEDIEVVKKFKYLGMMLDAPYLTWEPHITMIIEKCTKNNNILRAIAGTKFGADRDSILKINEALNRSRIAYGCPAFLSASKTQLNRLEVLQNTALRIAIGAWRSTRICNLQVEANVVPITFYIQQQSISLYYKMKAKGPTHPVHTHIFNPNHRRNLVWTKLFKKPFAIQVESILNSWNLSNNPMLETLLYPIIPPWFNLGQLIEHDLVTPTNKSMGKEQNKQSVLETLRTKYHDYTHIYTDGSKSNDDKTGAAFLFHKTLPTQIGDSMRPQL